MKYDLLLAIVSAEVQHEALPAGFTLPSSPHWSQAVLGRGHRHYQRNCWFSPNYYKTRRIQFVQVTPRTLETQAQRPFHQQGMITALTQIPHGAPHKPDTPRAGPNGCGSLCTHQCALLINTSNMSWLDH